MYTLRYQFTRVFPNIYYFSNISVGNTTLIQWSS